MLYKTEFPDYDGDFKVCSYHNDICPHVAMMFIRGNTEVEYDIWQDYKDPNKRECSSERYLFCIKVNGDLVFGYDTDEWKEIENLLPHLEVLDYIGWKNDLV